MNKIYQIYQVSDSTGETLDRIFLAIKAQFSNFNCKTIHYSFTRTKNQLNNIISKSKTEKNVIFLYTIVDNELSKYLDYIKIDPGVSMEDVLCLKETDVVYHLAWTTTPGPANQNPIYDVSSNIKMSLQILEACVKGNVKKLIFASSGGTVYGIPNSIPIKESHPTNPINSYGFNRGYHQINKFRAFNCIMGANYWHYPPAI